MDAKNICTQSSPTPSIRCSEWLEEKRSLYESNKDMRILHEYYDPEDKKGVKATAIYPNDPRYNDLKKGLFVENYEQSLKHLEELDRLVREMVQAGY